MKQGVKYDIGKGLMSYFSEDSVVFVISTFPDFIRDNDFKVTYFVNTPVKDVNSYKSIEDFMNNYTSLDPKITHIVGRYERWDNIPSILPPRKIISHDAYLILEGDAKKWKYFLDHEKFLIENAIKEYSFVFDNLILNDASFYAIFKRVIK